MSFEINIENGISIYTADELLGYSRSGMLYAGNVCLSDLVDKIVEEYESKIEEAKEASGEAYEERYYEGYRAAVSEMAGFVDNM